MKDYDQFRGSVYQKAAIRREKTRERNRQLRNAALCAAVILAVGTAIPLTRSHRLTTKDFALPTPEFEAAQNASLPPNAAAPDGQPRMLVVIEKEGKAQAVVLKNRDEQQAFVNQYSASNQSGKAALVQEDSEALVLHSQGELSIYLAQQLPDEAPVDIVDDYDEAFFTANDLRAVPMDLTEEPTHAEIVPETTTAPTETTTDLFAETTTAAEEFITIPDGPSAPAAPDAATTTEAAELALLPSTTVPADELKVSIRGAKVFILVPVPR
ncbi:MAG: hypothetical protein LBG83_04430 [Oscillospiraceae bacterium]|jgi:hypothetical protein|nr:hypothetical protein [Oscillospiraceae bacterium]